jgi:hypothetical protein
MARYAVHEQPDGSLLLDVQANFLSALNTRAVVPLMHHDEAPKPAK